MPKLSSFSSSRRKLLGLIAASFAAVAPSGRHARAAPSAAPTRGRQLVLLETHVAGTPYYQAARVRNRLRPGQRLSLRRQPTNRYDALAIEVFTRDGAKLGYVPRSDNEAFARLLDAGRTVVAEVVSVDDRRYDDIRIRLSLTD